MVLGLILIALAGPRADFALAWPAWQLNLLSGLAGLASGMLLFTAIQVLGLLMARQEAMGGGDVKFAGLIGAFLGWRLGLMAFGLSLVLGVAIAVPLALARGRLKEPVPFGTFMAVAAVLVALFGESFLP